MAWELKADRPIYIQLVEELERRIVSGQYPPGSQLPAVRVIAAEAAVNPNTMQKALAELERTGLVYAKRTSGRFITEDEAMINAVKKEVAVEKIEEFFEAMRQLGYSKEEVVSCIVTSAAQSNE